MLVKHVINWKGELLSAEIIDKNATADTTTLIQYHAQKLLDMKREKFKHENNKNINQEPIRD